MASTARQLAASPTYLVAKYVPDLDRMEPRNIGVVVWDRGRVTMRFAPASELDYVNDQDTYERWVSHWRRLANHAQIQIRNRRPVSQQSPRFLHELRLTQKGSYLLDEGGIVTDAVRPDQLEEVAAFLFERLVSKASPVREGADNFRERCDGLIVRSGLAGSPHFQKDYRLDLDVEGALSAFKYHYGVVAEGRPRSLFQRISAVTPAAVSSTAFLFEWASRSTHITADRCVSLLQSTEELSESAGSLMSVLGKFSTIIDVSIADQAIEKMRNYAA